MRVRLRTERLQRLLAASRLSQNHWALKIGISRGHWSDIVNGRHPYPSAKTRGLMLEVFGVPLDELFEIEQGVEDLDFRAAIADRYLIERDLGAGGMGHVYLARDMGRGRMVAVKTIAQAAAAGSGTHALEREISAIAQLQHPNILPLFDSGTLSGYTFLVMPWIRDGSLRDRLTRDGTLNTALVAKFAADLAHGLIYAHKQRVLHCDIKPENILLQGDHAYLADFGISRVLHPDASEYRARGLLDTSAGTPAYVSPEQASGEGDVGPASDQYSLACVLWEAFAGHPPFEGTTTLEVVSRRFTATPPDVRRLAPAVPDRVARALERAMSVHPDKRFPSVVEFAEELHCGVGDRTSRVQILRAAGQRVIAPWRRLLRAWSRTRGAVAVGTFGQDLRQAVRGLFRAPQFIAATMVPLALGLGAGATFIGLVDHLMFRAPPGVEDAERVVRLVVDTRSNSGSIQTTNSLAWIDYDVVARQSQSLEGTAGFFTRRTNLGRGEDASEILITEATPSFFSVLGARPQRGRFFTDTEDVRAATDVPCVASDKFWNARYARSDAIVGARVIVGQITCTIIGVTARGFKGVDLQEIDLWVPVQSSAPTWQGLDPELWTTDNSHWLRIIAKLRAGTTVAAGSSDATRAYRSFTSRGRDKTLDGVMRLEPIQAARGTLQSAAARQAVLLALAAGLLALLVVVNLANAFLARDLGRRRELAIRQALGVGSLRLWRAHLIECSAIAVAGAVGALVVATWLAPIVKRALFATTVWDASVIDGRVALLALASALIVGVLVSTFSTLHTRGREATAVLRTSSATASKRTMRLRHLMVALQAALTMVLLSGSVAFVLSFRKATAVDVGFDIDHVIRVRLPGSGTLPPRYEELRTALAAVPGVRAASFAYMTPWNNNATQDVFSEQRDTMPPVPIWQRPLFDIAGIEHFDAMGFEMADGRWFTSGDIAGSPQVVVVNEALVRHYWGPTVRGIGRCLRLSADTMPCREIVGVVRDFRMAGSLAEPPLPSITIPQAQRGENPLSQTAFVRVAGSAEELIPAIRRVAQPFSSEQGSVTVRRVKDDFVPLIASYRTGALTFSALGIVAIIVALAGLHAMLAFLVAERRPEFAVRAALGASLADISGPVTRLGLLTVTAGVLGGILVLIVAAPRVDPLLFHTSLLSPVSLLSTAASCLAVAWLATRGPSRAAAKQDPMLVIRGG